MEADKEYRLRDRQYPGRLYTPEQLLDRLHRDNLCARLTKARTRENQRGAAKEYRYEQARAPAN